MKINFKKTFGQAPKPISGWPDELPTYGAKTDSKVGKANTGRVFHLTFALSEVRLMEYDVLLSYPNWTTPNHVSVLSDTGEVLFRTTGLSPDLIPPDGVGWEAKGGDRKWPLALLGRRRPPRGHPMAGLQRQRHRRK
jgi:hypothetical protein